MRSEWVAEFNAQLLDLDVSQDARDEAPAAHCVQPRIDLMGLSMSVLAEAQRAAGGEVLHATITVHVSGDSGSCAISTLPSGAGAETRDRRDAGIAACEAIGAVLASLRRLDRLWHDEDVRETLRQARAALSVAQSKIKERIEL